MFTKQRTISLWIVGAIVLVVGIAIGYFGSSLVGGMQQGDELESLSAQTTPDTEQTPAPTPTLPEESPLSVNAPAEVEQTPTPTPEPPKEQTAFLVTDYVGKIAVYRKFVDGETALTSILDVDVTSLPVVDQEKLREGIEVKTEEEMLQLLEDYMS